MRLGATSWTFPVGTRMCILAIISILASIWLQKGTTLGLDLVVGMAVLADKGGHIVSKSILAGNGYPLRHEDIVLHLEQFPNIHKDSHGLSGFDVRCNFVGDYQFSHPILKPCGELEHTGRQFGWQCVHLIDQINLVASSFGEISFQHMNKIV